MAESEAKPGQPRSKSRVNASPAPSGTFELTEVPDTDHNRLLAQYDREAFAGSKFATDILMYLDAGKVMKLRHEFLAKDDGLAMHEFVFVLKNFLQSEAPDDEVQLKGMSDRVLVSNLCELFEQIDINGDGTMEWDEFTSFIVETGMHDSENQQHAISQYHPLPYLDLSKHFAPVSKLHYMEQLDQVVACEQGSNTLKLLDPSCHLQATISRDDGFFMAVDHIPETGHIVTSSSDLQISFYDDSYHRLHKCFHTPSSQMCVRWCKEAETLFTAGVSGVVHCWDAQHMEERYHMGGLSRDGTPLKDSHEDIVLDLLTMPSLEILASGSMDHTIRLWDMHTGKSRKVLTGHSKGVRSLAYSQEYRFLVSAGFDYDAMVWNPYVEKLILPLHGHNSSLTQVTIVDGTPQIITGDADGIFKLWDVRTFGCVQTFTADDADELNSFACLPKHRRVMSGGKRFHLFDYEKQENPELTDDVIVFDGKFNSMSNTFITGAGRDIKVWSAITGELIRRYRMAADCDLTAMCLDGRQRKFITGDHEGSVLVFDYLNGAQQKVLYKHKGEVTALVYCARDQSVISASRDLTIIVCDESNPEKGALLKEMRGGHKSEIGALAFSQHLSLVASGCHDGHVCVWDYEFGKLAHYLLGHTCAITCITFLDPLPLVAVADHNGSVAIWAVRPSPLAGNVVARFVNTPKDAAPGTVSIASPVLTMTAHVEVVAVERFTAPKPSTTSDTGAATAAAGAGEGEGGGEGAGEGEQHAEPAAAGEAEGEAEGGEKAEAKPETDAEEEGGQQVPTPQASPRLGHSRRAKVVHKALVKLYAADERGTVTVWDISELAEALREGHGVVVVEPHPAMFPRRNLLADISSHVANVKDTPLYEAYKRDRRRKSPFFNAPGYPLCPSSIATVAATWQAHSDAIYGMELIEQPPSIMTTSFDRLAKVWTREGQRMGTLQQGGVKLPWLFRVQNEAKIARMEKIAHTTMKKLKAEIPADEQRKLLERLTGRASAMPPPGSSRKSRKGSRKRSRKSARGTPKPRNAAVPRDPAAPGEAAAVPASHRRRRVISSPMARFYERRAARLRAEAGSRGVVEGDDDSGYYTPFVRRSSPLSPHRQPEPAAIGAGAPPGSRTGTQLVPRPPVSGQHRARSSARQDLGIGSRGRRRAGSKGKSRGKSRGKRRGRGRAVAGADKASTGVLVPQLNLDKMTEVTRSSTPDMNVDVLQDLRGDSDEDERPVITNSGPMFTARARSPIRTTPRLAPITARTAGRGSNATHKGLIRRSTQAAWREHRFDVRELNADEPNKY